jgi:hypothetical protein
MATGDFKNGANLIGKILCSTQVGNAETTVYTVPANTHVKVSHGVITNVSAAAVSVSVALVPSGGAADGTHRIIYQYSLAAGDSLSLDDYLANAMLGPGDFISVLASAAAAIDVVITGAVSS